MKKKNATIAPPIQQAAEQFLDEALQYLTDPTLDADEIIRQTRRRLKRLRAILRLVKGELKRSVYKRDNLYFRDQSRALSAVRDAAVMQTTVTKLKEQAVEALPAQEWKSLQKDLANTNYARNKRKVIAAVTANLKLAREHLADWDLRFAEEKPLRKSLRKIYRKGQRAMHRALDTPTTENLHEWRKQLNHLRHQLRLLQALQLVTADEFLRMGKPLAKALGRNNDLAVLSDHLRTAVKTAGLSEPVLQQLIQAEQNDFIEKAVTLGKALFAPKPKAFLRQIWPPKDNLRAVQQD